MDATNVDVTTTVRRLAGPSATVKPAYGGLEILVLDEEAFPWGQVFGAIRDIGQDVWIKGKPGALIVRSKPPAI